MVEYVALAVPALMVGEGNGGDLSAFLTAMSTIVTSVFTWVKCGPCF